MDIKNISLKDLIHMNKAIYLHISILSLFVGSLIYCLFRENSLFYINNSLPKTYKWIKYNLPDAMWIYSFTIYITSIWINESFKKKILWFAVPISISLLYEYSQKIFKFGTYDKIDILFYCVAYTTAISNVYLINRYLNTKKK